jgi:hypothetical protein
VIWPERELLGFTSFDRQAEQVAEHGEDQPLTVGRDGHIGCCYFSGLDFDCSPATWCALCVLSEERERREQERHEWNQHEAMEHQTTPN